MPTAAVKRIIATVISTPLLQTQSSGFWLLLVYGVLKIIPE
jgi:hypothetical protein